MENNTIKLNYYQLSCFVHKIEEIKKNNPNFKDEIVDSFTKNFLKELAHNILTLRIPDVLLKNLKLYTIDIVLFNYLKDLTKIDVLDKSLMKEYKKYIDAKINSTDSNKILEDNLSNTKKVLEKRIKR